MKSIHNSDGLGQSGRVRPLVSTLCNIQILGLFKYSCRVKCEAIQKFRNEKKHHFHLIIFLLSYDIIYLGAPFVFIL